MARKRKSKSMGKIFHNETTVDGIKFDSETEAKYYMYIRDNKEKLNTKEIELQPEFLLQNKYIKLRETDERPYCTAEGD